MRKFNLALIDYTKAIELNSNDTKASNNRRNLYKENGQYDKAFQDCIQALKLESDNPLIMVNLDDHYFRPNYNQSLKYYTQALAQLDQITQQKRKKWNLSEKNIQFIQKKNQTLNDVKDKFTILERKLTVQLMARTDLKQPQEKQEELDPLQLIKEDMKQIRQQLVILQEIVNQQNEIISNLEDDNKQLKNRIAFKHNRKQNSIYLLKSIENFFRIILNEQRCYDSKQFQKSTRYSTKGFQYWMKGYGFIPVGGEAFNIIHDALDYANESKKENKFNPSELEIKVKITAIDLAKQQQQETLQQNNQQFNQFLVKLNKIENQKDEQNEYWKNGTNDALIILKYLNDQSSSIIENSDKKLRQIFVEVVEMNNKQQNQVQQQQQGNKIQKVQILSNPSSLCSRICLIS
ncbi:unnamed protein product [Paramecium pentaurelia]|uniref:Tetratricopeptide repeat protein n=1 Tax=Paramecium pentaurelia TaxID=43138 RepID=A0A8S1UX37_9CILI|nr:unnamed protein product [Paramecium pentaurelia]